MHRTRTLFITVAAMVGTAGALHAMVPVEAPAPPVVSVDGTANVDVNKIINDAFSSAGGFLDLANGVTDEDIATAAAELDQAKAELATTENRVRTGMAPEPDLIRARTAVTVAQEKLKKLQGLRNRSMQRDSLNKPVDVQLKNAPIRQVAEALSRASGVKVTVNPGVSDEQKVTLDARHVPLASVLEAVARQANLIIYPTDDGVALGPWPSLTVNGESRKTNFRNAPWSDDWILPPTRFPGLFGGGGGGMSLIMPGMNIDVPNAPDGTFNRLPRNLYGGVTPGPGPGSFSAFGVNNGASVTSVGDHVIVAEPGRDKQGRPGVWLTVYRLDGDNLTQVSQSFQPSQGGERTLSLNVRPPGGATGGGVFRVLPPVPPREKPNR